MAKVLGPAGNAVGVAQEGLGKVTGLIDKAKTMAQQAQDHAKKIEDQIAKFQSMSRERNGRHRRHSEGRRGPRGPRDVGPPSPRTGRGAETMMVVAAVGAPLSPRTARPKAPARRSKKAERQKVEEDHKWDEARDAPIVPPPRTREKAMATREVTHERDRDLRAVHLRHRCRRPPHRGVALRRGDRRAVPPRADRALCRKQSRGDRAVAPRTDGHVRDAQPGRGGARSAGASWSKRK